MQPGPDFPHSERKLRIDEKFFSIPVISINANELVKKKEIIKIIINKIEGISAIHALKSSNSPIHQVGNAHRNLLKQ